MSQKEVNELILLLVAGDQELEKCTGNADTCPVEECVLCAVRDCPGNEPLHYHHDGCPYCYHYVEGYK